MRGGFGLAVHVSLAWGRFRPMLRLLPLLACLLLPACFAAEDTGDGCINEIDDDGDGMIDCEDFDCSEDPACLGDDDDSAAGS